MINKAQKFVCSADQAKNLKDLGILQESYFKWLPEPVTGNMIVVVQQGVFPVDGITSAFCDTELAVMLDAFYETYRTDSEKWSGSDLSPDYDTPAQATASNLIWLLQNDERLTVEIANERLLNFYKT